MWELIVVQEIAKTEVTGSICDDKQQDVDRTLSDFVSEVRPFYVENTCLEYLLDKKEIGHDQTGSVLGNIQILRPNCSVLLPVQTDTKSTGFADNTMGSLDDVTEACLHPLRIFDTVVTKITKVCPPPMSGVALSEVHA